MRGVPPPAGVFFSKKTAHEVKPSQTPPGQGPPRRGTVAEGGIGDFGSVGAIIGDPADHGRETKRRRTRIFLRCNPAFEKRLLQTQ